MTDFPDLRKAEIRSVLLAGFVFADFARLGFAAPQIFPESHRQPFLALLVVGHARP